MKTKHLTHVYQCPTERVLRFINNRTCSIFEMHFDLDKQNPNLDFDILFSHYRMNIARIMRVERQKCLRKMRYQNQS